MLRRRKLGLELLLLLLLLLLMSNLTPGHFFCRLLRVTAMGSLPAALKCHSIFLQLSDEALVVAGRHGRWRVVLVAGDAREAGR